MPDFTSEVFICTATKAKHSDNQSKSFLTVFNGEKDVGVGKSLSCREIVYQVGER